MAKTSRILLTGFMGCGKSAVGQILASILSKKFIDLDKTIEDLHNLTVEQIFAQSGEDAFRQLETSTLVTLPENVVCALGGGTLMREENLQWALHHGHVLYLSASTAELVARLIKDPTVRPLLRQHDGESLSEKVMEERVERLLSNREPVYSLAHHTLNTDGLTPAEVAHLCARVYRNLKE
ncbi:MAG: shikimate kinase [Bacteroidetes bacterium]|nr:shikimate kinase [Bacteroidota bacterium]